MTRLRMDIRLGTLKSATFENACLEFDAAGVASEQEILIGSVLPIPGRLS